MPQARAGGHTFTRSGTKRKRKHLEQNGQIFILLRTLSFPTVRGRDADAQRFRCDSLLRLHCGLAQDRSFFSACQGGARSLSAGHLPWRNSHRPEAVLRFPLCRLAGTVHHRLVLFVFYVFGSAALARRSPPEHNQAYKWRCHGKKKIISLTSENSFTIKKKKMIHYIFRTTVRGCSADYLRMPATDHFATKNREGNALTPFQPRCVDCSGRRANAVKNTPFRD